MPIKITYSSKNFCTIWLKWKKLLLSFPMTNCPEHNVLSETPFNRLMGIGLSNLSLSLPVLYQFYLFFFYPLVTSLFDFFVIFFSARVITEILGAKKVIPEKSTKSGGKSAEKDVVPFKKLKQSGWWNLKLIEKRFWWHRIYFDATMLLGVLKLTKIHFKKSILQKSDIIS